MESKIPCVVVASKADLAEVKQFHGTTPAEFCYKHRLPPPLPFSTILPNSTSKNIYTRLAKAAMYPYAFILHQSWALNIQLFNCQRLSKSVSLSHLSFFISRHLNGSEMSSTSFWLRVALGSAVVAVLGFTVYRAVVRLKWFNNQLCFYLLILLWVFFSFPQSGASCSHRDQNLKRPDLEPLQPGSFFFSS